jgi:hypothetical protein
MMPTLPTLDDICRRLEVFASRIGEVQTAEDQSEMTQALVEIHSVVELVVTGGQSRSRLLGMTPGDHLCGIVTALRQVGPTLKGRDHETIALLAPSVDNLFEGLGETFPDGWYWPSYDTQGSCPPKSGVRPN